MNEIKKFVIDINSDVGEGIGNEKLIFPFISSCNIACGGHAGDVHTATAVIRFAKEHELKIGAHPSYPDRANFGRKSMQLKPSDLIHTLREQLKMFMSLLEKENSEPPHEEADDVSEEEVHA